MADKLIPVTAFDRVLRLACEDPVSSQAARVRIEDVARVAGVSPITVSRTLRKSSIVSEATRQRVHEAVRTTGFSLNPHASALRSGRSNIVTAFLSSTASEQFLRAATTFSTILEEAGYEVVLARTSYSYERELRLVRTLEQIRPAGAFITGVLEQEQCRRIFRRLAIPVVESWANSDDPIDMLVAVSNTDGARAAARALAERGYRRLAFIGRISGRGVIRRDAFRTECCRLGLDYAGDETLSTVTSTEDGRIALSRLLQRVGPVDAVFCANDLLACGALIEARARGLSIPQDLALVGFGDSSLMEQLEPALTTITPDPDEIGRHAGALLRARLAGEVQSETVIPHPLHLRIRRSC